MPSRRGSVSFVGLLGLALTPAIAAQGVRVDDQAAISGPAAALDLQEGDRFLAWERGGRRGWLAIPFDLEALAVEEGPLGEVTLRGDRNGAELVVRVPAGRWSIPSRPAWSSGEDAEYLAARDLLPTDRDAALAAWADLARRWSQAGRPGIAAWLWRRIARERAAAGEAQAAEVALGKGLAAAALAAEPRIEAALRAEPLRASPLSASPSAARSAPAAPPAPEGRRRPSSRRR